NDMSKMLADNYILWEGALRADGISRARLPEIDNGNCTEAVKNWINGGGHESGVKNMLRDKSDNVAESESNRSRGFRSNRHSAYGAPSDDYIELEGFSNKSYDTKYWYGTNNGYTWDQGARAVGAHCNGRLRSTYQYGKEVLTKAVPMIAVLLSLSPMLKC
ncbi:uncharacterized protein V1516DRAFT_667031, partial [Lipomyces oligophaga]|uniref:uncharacterized protein n=1 Tax=Lipomyces oligophaga TaxID=45792 RepID=UPI0034CF72BD